MAGSTKKKKQNTQLYKKQKYVYTKIIKKIEKLNYNCLI